MGPSEEPVLFSKSSLGASPSYRARWSPGFPLSLISVGGRGHHFSLMKQNSSCLCFLVLWSPPLLFLWLQESESHCGFFFFLCLPAGNYGLWATGQTGISGNPLALSFLGPKISIWSVFFSLPLRVFLCLFYIKHPEYLVIFSLGNKEVCLLQVLHLFLYLVL
jgi:hypothetical protein